MRNYYKEIKEIFELYPNYFFCANDFKNGYNKDFNLKIIPINLRYVKKELDKLVKVGIIEIWLIRSHIFYKKVNKNERINSQL